MLDHLVWVTGDIDATAAELAAATGVEAGFGGAHVDRGTHNRLASFGNGQYLEIIGPDPTQPEPAMARAFGVDDLTAPGIATWCARSSDLAGVVARAEAAGYELTGPMAMQRESPEGLLSWELAIPTGDIEGGILPFFIDWADSPHPSDATPTGLTLSRLAGVHPDPARVTDVLAALGEHVDIDDGSAPGLTATITGPAGSIDVGAARFA